MAVLGEAAKRRRACSSADHDDIGGRIVRHQERRAERTRDFELGTARKIAEIIRTNAFVFALDRQRKIVGIALLAIAGTGHRIKRG